MVIDGLLFKAGSVEKKVSFWSRRAQEGGREGPGYIQFEKVKWGSQATDKAAHTRLMYDIYRIPGCDGRPSSKGAGGPGG